MMSDFLPAHIHFRKSLLAIVLLLLTHSGMSQNMVQNGDFENYNWLPYSYGNLNYCVDVINPNQASTDYFHVNGSWDARLPYTFAGNVNPFSGLAIAGLVTQFENDNYREYISFPLTSPMVPGTAYQVSFWFTNGYSGYRAPNSTNIGVWLSEKTGQATPNYRTINVTPQFDVGAPVWSDTWVQLSFVLEADSAYRYVTIGNFYDDAHTIIQRDVVYSVSDFAYYFIDKVEVMPSQHAGPIPIVELKMPNLITPNHDGSNDEFVPIEYRGIISSRTRIYNRWGGLVHDTDDFPLRWDAEDASDGVYYWSVIYKDIFGNEKNVNGTLSVIR